MLDICVKLRNMGLRVLVVKENDEEVELIEEDEQ